MRRIKVVTGGNDYKEWNFVMADTDAKSFFFKVTNSDNFLGKPILAVIMFCDEHVEHAWVNGKGYTVKYYAVVLDRTTSIRNPMLEEIQKAIDYTDAFNQFLPK